MTLSYSKQQIVLALKSTFIGDSKILKQTTEYLQYASTMTGYCMKLMEIADQGQHSIEIKQAALIQLKNSIKSKWSATKNEIEAAQKESIKGILLVAVIRCAKSHKLIKMYRQVLTQIITHEYKTWMPIVPIIEKIQSNQDLIPIIHVLLAIAASFEFSINEDERVYFFNFLKVILPKLLELVQRQIQYSELVYLNIKFLWKAIHYEINQEIKLLTIGWMPLIQSVVSLTNAAFDVIGLDEYQLKDTPQFYYFHSKKWATRIFLRYIQKHAKKSSYNKQDNSKFACNWYQVFGACFINGLMTQFVIPTTKKVRYFQLKCVQALISQRSDDMKKYAQIFQYDILLKHLKLQPDDEEVAQRDPVEFLSKQNQPSMNFTNLKRVATDVWVAFAQLGSKMEKKGQQYQPGVFFYANMNYLQGKLQAANMIEKQLAMYLICQLRSTISKCKPVKKMLPMLISKYIIPQFKNEIMFLRARAVDIFYEYGTMQFDTNVIKLSVEGIYHCLMNDAYPLVRIKAAQAFNCILKHKSAKQLVRPLLKDILTIYLQLLQKYDLQSLVNSLESIVEDFSKQIGPFAYDLCCYLTKLFFKLFNRDMQQSQNDEYDGQAELAAAGCLKIITQIIQSPIIQDIVIKMQPEILSILQFIFGSSGSDYIQDSLILLNAYLFKSQKLTPAIWFYYQVVVYNVVGIPKEMWVVIDKLALCEKQRNIMKSIKGGQNWDMMQQSMPAIRNFIRKGATVIMENQEAFRTNLVQLLFYLINQVYKKGPTEFGGQVQMTSCTALLIYLLQNYKFNLQLPIFQHIWQIAKINMTKVKSKLIKILNSQLLAMLIWANPTKVVDIITKDNYWTTYLREIVGYECRYEQQHERIRSILGLNTLLALPLKNNYILAKIPEIFKMLIKMVKKNADNRLQDDQDAKKLKFDDSDDEQGDMQGYDFDSDDDQNFWEEQYDDNYSSALDQIDQIAQFKTTIQSLAHNQPHLYSQLMKVVSQEDLNILADKIKKAIDKVEELSSTS